MDQQVSFNRRILLCVTGLTPQVVTETLYALYQEHKPMPTEIHLITTANGRNRAERDLLAPIDGKFLQFCDEFNLNGQIDFPAKNIHVIRGRYNEELPDIRTPQENECAADFIMQRVKAFCADDSAQLSVSIAGGRKSMGFLAGYALSIFGRPQDNLTHVLTSEPFENNRDFFYPSAKANPIFSSDGSPLNPLEAKISLADIPLIKLRSGLTTNLLECDGSFSKTVQLAQQEVAPPIHLSFDIEKRQVNCGGQTVQLTPAEFVIFYWFASLRKDNLLPCLPGVSIDFPHCFDCAKKIMGPYSTTCEKLEQANKFDGDFKQYFQEKRTKINKKLRSNLRRDQFQIYKITSNGKKYNVQYTLNIPPHLIKLNSD